MAHEEAELFELGCKHAVLYQGSQQMMITEKWDHIIAFPPVAPANRASEVSRKAHEDGEKLRKR